MNCIIIDDEVTAREILKLLCARIKYLTVVAEFDNVRYAAKYLEEQKVDIIFLDIHMEGLSGFDLLDRIKWFSKDHLPKVIITSSDKNLAFKGFEYKCTDFLLKPIELLRFKKSINKVAKILKYRLISLY